MKFYTCTLYTSNARDISSIKLAPTHYLNQQNCLLTRFLLITDEKKNQQPASSFTIRLSTVSLKIESSFAKKVSKHYCSSYLARSDDFFQFVMQTDIEAARNLEAFNLRFSLEAHNACMRDTDARERTWYRAPENEFGKRGCVRECVPSRGLRKSSFVLFYLRLELTIAFEICKSSAMRLLIYLVLITLQLVLQLISKRFSGYCLACTL